MINLALVGVGKWGVNYLNEVSKIKDCQIKYICSKSPSTLSKFPNSYTKVTDYKKLLDLKDVDGVIIATPATTHFKIAKDFLSKGYNVLVEKPVVLSQKDAKKLSTQINKNIFMAGHIKLYSPALIKIKKLLPKIGDVISIDLQSGNNGPFRNDISVLWDWGPHLVSMMLYLFETEPWKISAIAVSKLRDKTKLYDIVSIRLQYQNKMIANLQMSWLLPKKIRTMLIIGTKGSIFLDELANNQIVLYQNTTPKKTSGKLQKSEPRITHPQYPKNTPLFEEIRELINCINQGRNPKTDINHLLKVTRLLELVEKSIRQNGKLLRNFLNN